MKRIVDFLTENPIFFYATMDGDQPRVRPFAFFMIHKDRFYIAMGTHKPCYRQTMANPKVEISAAAKDGRWLRLRGKAVADADPAALAKAFETMPELKNMYNDASKLTLGLFYIADGEAEFCNTAGACEKMAF